MSWEPRTCSPSYFTVNACTWTGRTERSSPKLCPTSGLGTRLGSEVFPLGICFSALLPASIFPTWHYQHPPPLPVLKILCLPSSTLTFFSGSSKASCPGIHSGQTSARCPHLDRRLPLLLWRPGSPHLHSSLRLLFARSLPNHTQLPSPDIHPASFPGCYKRAPLPAPPPNTERTTELQK